MRSIASQGNIKRNEIYKTCIHAEQIKRIWKEGSGRYGVRKVWQKLKHEGYVVARCTVARLMQKLSIHGV